MTSGKKTMLLEGDYYTLTHAETDNVSGLFTISINPASSIFQGHFPGTPVCPGVCSVELVRECASIVMEHEVRMSRISKCRFLSVIRPQDNRPLLLSLSITQKGDDICQLKAKMSCDGADLMTLAGEATI